MPRRRVCFKLHGLEGGAGRTHLTGHTTPRAGPDKLPLGCPDPTPSPLQWAPCCWPLPRAASQRWHWCAWPGAPSRRRPQRPCSARGRPAPMGRPPRPAGPPTRAATGQLPPARSLRRAEGGHRRPGASRAGRGTGRGRRRRRSRRVGAPAAAPRGWGRCPFRGRPLGGLAPRGGRLGCWGRAAGRTALDLPSISAPRGSGTRRGCWAAGLSHQGASCPPRSRPSRRTCAVARMASSRAAQAARARPPGPASGAGPAPGPLGAQRAGAWWAGRGRASAAAPCLRPRPRGRILTRRGRRYSPSSPPARCQTSGGSSRWAGGGEEG